MQAVKVCLLGENWRDATVYDRTTTAVRDVSTALPSFRTPRRSNGTCSTPAKFTALRLCARFDQVACAEWRKTLRWMLGIPDWDTGPIHEQVSVFYFATLFTDGNFPPHTDSEYFCQTKSIPGTLVQFPRGSRRRCIE